MYAYYIHIYSFISWSCLNLIRFIMLLVSSVVIPVSRNLLATYRGNPDQAWWNDIVLKQSNVEQVGGTYEISKHRT